MAFHLIIKQSVIASFLFCLDNVDSLTVKPIDFFENLSVNVSTTREDSFATKIVSDGETYGICNIFNINTFLEEIKTGFYESWSLDLGMSELAAILLGVHHFNNRNNAVVAEIGNISDKCKVRFTVDCVDSYFSEKNAVALMTTALSTKNKACVFLGGASSSISVPLASISGAAGVPFLSHYATSTELDKHSQYPFFSRLIPSDTGIAEALVLYLSNTLSMEHINIVHVNDDYGYSYAQAIQKYAFSVNLHTETFALPDKPTDSELDQLLSNLKMSEVRIFVAITFDFDALMEAATKKGLVGAGYFWICTDATEISEIQGTYKEDSQKEKILSRKGVGIIKTTAGNKGLKGFDKYIEAYHTVGMEEISYFNSKLPIATNKKAAEKYKNFTLSMFNPDDKNYNKVQQGALFLYDSVIAMGLAACESVDEEGIFFKPEDQYFYFTNRTPFEGASGTIALDPLTKSRDPKSVFFTIFNAVQQKDTGGSITSVAQKSMVFSNGKWTQKSPFIYADGTTDTPQNYLPLEEERNLIDSRMLVFGYVLCFIVLALSVCFIATTIIYRDSPVMKAAQPHFLCLICVGTFVLGTTIVPFGIDERFVDANMDSVCMISPWLIFIGSGIIFPTIYIKLRRISKILNNDGLSRVSAAKVDAIPPFIVINVLNIVILFLWTILSPLKFERINISYDKFDRVSQSSGQCTIDKEGWIFFGILIFLNFCALISVNFQAFIARNISSHFSESKFLFIAMLSTLQILLIGIPLLFIATSNRSAIFFIRAMIVFVICTANLLFIFIPKLMVVKKVGTKDIVASLRKQSTIPQEGKRSPAGYNSKISNVARTTDAA